MNKVLLAAILVLAMGAAVVRLSQETTMSRLLDLIGFQSSGGEFPPLTGATGWLNSEPLTPAGLRGKVILVQFWTYSCINWLRTEPYTRAWADKYRDKGLVVIGVHSPEFGFEKDADNVLWAVKNYRVDYPVAIDSDHGIWSAFGNRYWPALYLIDKEGRIRHHQFGEGGYAETEHVLQQLLGEGGATTLDHDPVIVDGNGAEANADWDDLQSGETYVGYERTANFSSPGGVVFDTRHVYATPEMLSLDHWSLLGSWTVGREAISAHAPNGRIAFRFHARDLNLVMGPAVRGNAIRFRVLIDGQPPVGASGADVDGDGNGIATEPRLYQLIRQRPPIGDRTFEIEFLDPGAEAFSFTFG